MNLANGLSRMLAKLYAAAATPMTFRSPKTQKSVSIQAIDRTSLLVESLQSLKFGNLKLVCTVLSADLAALGLADSDMIDATVTFAGNSLRILAAREKPDPSWRVVNNQFKPVPNWGTNGEIIFELMDLT
jgi:hypothetical protein